MTPGLLKTITRRVLISGVVIATTLTGFADPDGQSKPAAFDDAALDALWAEFSRPPAPSVAVRRARIDRVPRELVEGVELFYRHALEVAREYREMAAENAPRPHQPGEMDLFPLWAEIPEPVPSLPEAKAVNCDVRYGGFVKKVETFQRQLADLQHKQNKYVDIHQREGDAGLESRARAEANRNAVVQQMGGAAAVPQMTNAQRKTAAKQAVNATVTQTPAAGGSGNLMTAMQAMAQLAAADAAYRERVDRMTPAEKFTELNRLMQEGEANPPARNDALFVSEMQERDQAVQAANVQLLLGNTLLKMQQVGLRLTPLMADCNESYSSLYRGIERWYARAFSALPVEASGESLEKKGLRELQQMRAMLTYAVNKEEAVSRAELWRLQKMGFKSALGEFNEFIGTYGWGKDDAGNLFRGTYEQPQIAEAVNSVYRDMIRLTQEAEHFTRENKGRQEQFEIALR